MSVLTINDSLSGTSLSSNKQPTIIDANGTVNITHNLGYMPNVQVINRDTGQVGVGIITHNSLNDFTVAVIGTVNIRINYN